MKGIRIPLLHFFDSLDHLASYDLQRPSGTRQTQVLASAALVVLTTTY